MSNQMLRMDGARVLRQRPGVRVSGKDQAIADLQLKRDKLEIKAAQADYARVQAEKKLKCLQKTASALLTALDKDVLKMIVAVAVRTTDDYGTYEAVRTMVNLMKTCFAFLDLVDTKLWISTHCVYYKKKGGAPPCFNNDTAVVMNWIGLYDTTFRRSISNRKWVALNNKLRDCMLLRDPDLFGWRAYQEVFLKHYYGDSPPSVRLMRIWDQTKPCWSAPSSVIEMFYVDKHMTFTMTQAMHVMGLKRDTLKMVPALVKNNPHGQGEVTLVYKLTDLRAVLRAERAPGLIRSAKKLRAMAQMLGIDIDSTATMCELRARLCVALGAYLQPTQVAACELQGFTW